MARYIKGLLWVGNELFREQYIAFILRIYYGLL
ncbi:Uncharacterised protein [Legionella oakridgensis]|nr:Uncharacterised protein [Legionella oakridgensis]